MIVPNIPTPSTNAATEQTAITGSREERQRDDRLRGPRLRVEQRDQHHHRDDQQRHDARRAPAVLRRPRQREQQRHDPADQRRESGPVQDVIDPARLHVRELEVNRRHRHGAERQIDVEAGAPRPVVGQPAAERRTENRRDAPQRGKESLVLAALDRRKDVADDREQNADRPCRRRCPAVRGRRSAAPCRRSAGT